MRYSEQTLTFSTNRLAALLGVASSIQKATGWTYVAGVWMERFLACLCWCNIIPVPMQPNLSNNAPTFSWASVSGCACYDDPLTFNLDHQTTIHAAFSRLDFNVIGSSRFDRVTSGTFVKLVGPVLEVRMGALYADENTSC